MPWLLVLSIIITACISVTSSLGYGNGAVLPNDPYIFIGRDLTLTCNLTKFNTEYDSQYLTFTRKNDETIPREYVEITSTRSILLRYPITGPDDGGNYICKLNRSSGRPEIIGNQFVQVEYEPRRITEIDCRVYNWQNMTCTWDLGVEYVHPDSTDVVLVWTTSGSQFDCPHQTRTSCSWWAVDDGDSFMRDMTYSMGVVVTNRDTLESSPTPTIFRVDTMRIVEPMPVSNLTTRRNSSCVTLKWQHDKVRPGRLFPPDIVYRVGFKSAWDAEWKTKHVGDAMTLTLCGLTPATAYHFNVTCKPRIMGKVRGFWSKPSTVGITTKEDIPTAAPELLAGSYMEQPCHQHYCRKVIVYWQPLQATGIGGDIVRYRLDYRNMEKAPPAWESVSVGGDNYEGTLLLGAGAEYLIQLRAATRVGVANVFSQIGIPPRSHKPPVPDIIVEAENMSADSLVTLTWEHPRDWTTPHWRNLSSYTVYWCQGYPVSRTCKAPITWDTVPVTATSYSLRVEVFETYLFGVAVNADTWSGETISSGIKWNQCTYTKHHKPEVAPSNVRLSPYQPSLGLSVEWDPLTCRNTYAYIRSYLVNVCLCQSGSNCTGVTRMFTVESAQSELLVPDLKDKCRYKIWVNAAALAGLGPDSDPVYEEVIDRSLNTGEISGIVIGSLFVCIIFLFGMILCSRRLFRMVKQRYFMPLYPIEVPNTLPPLPSIPMPPRQLSSSTESSEDGHYEKIDGPPSPCSSTESTTGVDAPLIHSKWKLANIKYHIYGKKKEQRASSDSGRGSLSHSADTLLMTLHPPHGKKSKKIKMKHKSESDSGVIIDNRGHAVCCFTNGESKRMDKKLVNTGEVNPYSCVDIVHKISTTSEQLKRKQMNGGLRNEGCENSGATDLPCSTYSTGSTMSLPPASNTDSSLQSQSLALRTKSADNHLDYEGKTLCSMLETSESVASDIYSMDCFHDDVEGRDNIVNLYENQEPLSSYVHITDMENCNLLDRSAPQINYIPACDCCCHGNVTPVVIDDGYVKQEVMFDHANHVCGCELEEKQHGRSTTRDNMKFLESDLVKVKVDERASSEVFGLAPDFFNSLTLMDADPANTTEL